MHVAVVLDGNRRYGERHQVDGHRAGLQALVRLLEHMATRVPVDIVTLFVWSKHNWKRSVAEIRTFRRLVSDSTSQLTDLAHKHKISYRVISTNTSRLSSAEVQSFRDLATQTSSYHHLVCNLCCSYSSQEEIAQAAAKGDIATHLLVPDPVDLLIRTAEQRLSDFLLWQCAFAEIIFCDQLFPDFTPQNFDQVWAQFPNRVRRYGH